MKILSLSSWRSLTISGILTFLIVLCAGCALTPRAMPSAKRSTAPTKPAIIGEVTIVDEEKRFVLIDLDANLYVPAPGSTLRTINPSGETGQLKASPEQKRPFIAAEIVEGNPAVGDQVVR